MTFSCEEKCSITLISQSKGWGMKRICKAFSIKKWAVSFEDQCTVEKTILIEQNTGSGRPWMWEQNRITKMWRSWYAGPVRKLHVTQEMGHDSEISQHWLLYTNTSSLMYFAIVKKCYQDAVLFCSIPLWGLALARFYCSHGQYWGWLYG